MFSQEPETTLHCICRTYNIQFIECLPLFNSSVQVPASLDGALQLAGPDLGSNNVNC